MPLHKYIALMDLSSTYLMFALHRQKRANGKEYAELLEEFMHTVKQNYGEKSKLYRSNPKVKEELLLHIYLITRREKVKYEACLDDGTLVAKTLDDGTLVAKTEGVEFTLKEG
ncbi:hypothetical protein TSUD_375100 [Trifolium subterraneum]|uniref:Uncharacterized protein n=1 Tax=Trifolium subterraneum TaxID=3900 RepID=A0A2Z6NG94_TRISU|nr:hypothetical protein TSUD_375100 [Trifolium subterraneum]